MLRNTPNVLLKYPLKSIKILPDPECVSSYRNTCFYPKKQLFPWEETNGTLHATGLNF